jgi:hypothetical protein
VAPVEDGYYNNPNWVRTGGAPGDMRKTKNVKGTSSLAYTGGPVGEDGYYNNPNYKRTGGEAGSQENSTNVRGTSSFISAQPPKGTKDEIQKFVKPCIENYESNDCVKTGGKYWEHDNDVPLHGVSSLNQYDAWTARDDSKETARIADCLKTPVGKNCVVGAGGY